MTFFTKPSPASQGVNAPLSRDRLEQVLTGDGVNFGIDDDGDIITGWEFGAYHLSTRGPDEEILFVDSFWRAPLPEESLAQTIAICTQWNRETAWPKAFPSQAEDGSVRINTQHAVDYEAGVSDAQLSLHIRSAVSGSEQFFEHLTQIFPDEWKAVSGDE